MAVKLELEDSDSDCGSNGPIRRARPTIAKSPRPAMAKRWCFTWNNYPDEWQNLLQHKLISEYIVGQEVGEQGTKHLQGYLECARKVRPMESLKWPKQVHWEKAKGSRAENVKYCSKEGSYIHSTGCKPIRPLKLITELRPWQQMVLDILAREPDDRSILWLFERNGNMGKSAMSKLLCAKYGAIICAGKAADMKHQIAEACKNGCPPEIVIFDVPRSSLGFISYTGIEEIKNGCFASQKYESGMVVMNSPHVLVFANEEPDYSAMSADRWNVHEIGVDPV